jgi:hypothetical protein
VNCDAAFFAGEAAYKHGLAVKDCPWPREDGERLWWCRGFTMARYQDRYRRRALRRRGDYAAWPPGREGMTTHVGYIERAEGR